MLCSLSTRRAVAPAGPTRALSRRGARRGVAVMAEATEGPAAVPVQFKMKRKLKFGMEACIIGSPSGTGAWKKAEASPMKWSDGDVWQATVPLTPGEEVEYKYLIRGDNGTVQQWQQGENLSLSVEGSAVSMTVTDAWEAMDEHEVVVEHQQLTAACPGEPSSAATEAGHPAAAVTALFELARELKYGQQLVMVGSTAALGAWDLQKAVQMKWTEGHVWHAKISIPFMDVPVEYKYVAVASTPDLKAEWEKGANHILAVEKGSTVVSVTDSWGQERSQPPVIVTAAAEEVPVAEEVLEEVSIAVERLEIITPSGRLVPKMTVRELKDECKELGIDSCGRKTELRVRLTEYLESSPVGQEDMAAAAVVA